MGTKINVLQNNFRYAMFKVGPVLALSHGMGVPSLSILLHEVIKLLAHAGAQDPVFFRLGTCGGIGLEGGTVIVSNHIVNGLLEPALEQASNQSPDILN
jgi:uridine phosphorylase